MESLLDNDDEDDDILLTLLPLSEWKLLLIFVLIQGETTSECVSRENSKLECVRFGQ